MISYENRASGEVGNIIHVFLENSVTGAPLTGLTNVSAGLEISLFNHIITGFLADNGNIESIAAIGDFVQPTNDTKIRFAEVFAAVHPGLYEIQFHDVYSGLGGGEIILQVFGATNLKCATHRIQLRDPLPEIDHINTAIDTVATTAQLNVVAGVVNNIYTDVHTAGVVVAAGSKTGYSLAGTQTFNNTGTWTGNLSGSVGSVAGNVSGTVHALDNGAITGNTIADGTLSAAKFVGGFIQDTSFSSPALAAIGGAGATAVWAYDYVTHAPAGTTYGNALANFGQSIETGITAKQALRAMLAVAAGNSTGGGSGTVRFKAAGGSADRVVADVDANGNRTNATITA